MEKKEFFKEPSAETISKGKIRIIKPGNLVSIIEKLQDNQFYVIDKNIIPLYSEEEIPYTSESEKNELPQRYLKRGPLVELNNNDLTLEKAIKNKKRILDLRKEKFDNLNLNEF